MGLQQSDKLTLIYLFVFTLWYWEPVVVESGCMTVDVKLDYLSIEYCLNTAQQTTVLNLPKAIREKMAFYVLVFSGIL